MELDIEKFIEVGKTVEYYGKAVILKLPHIPAVISCDIIIYMTWKWFKYFKDVWIQKKKWSYYKMLVHLQLLTKKLLVKFQNLFKQDATPERKWLSYGDKSENLRAV